MNDSFKKDLTRMLILVVGSIALCRFSQGLFVVALGCASFVFALSGKLDKLLVLYFLVPFLTIINGAILPKGVMFAYGARLTILMNMGLLLLRGVSSNRAERLPLGAIYAFLFASAISSIGGWCPLISYLKLISFALFISSLYLGSSLIADNFKAQNMMRALFMSATIMIVWGSLLTLPFPAIGYMTVQAYIAVGMSEAEAIAAMGNATALICGITSHSQTLGPLLSCSLGFLLCDMLFVQRKATSVHLLTFLAALPLLYLTRSRAALFSFIVMISTIMFVAMPKFRISAKLKSHVRSIFRILIFIALVASIVGEIKSDAITKWLRKVDNVDSDRRELSEAVTESRQGSIEANMYDFRQNPFLGMGFQVDYNTMVNYQSGHGSLISAPIEKGLLPLMILGESGVVGAIVFVCFLFSFFGACARKRYYVTASLFIVYLSTNMAEASFFSPLGAGGTEWLITALGGFTIDQIIKRDSRFDGAYIAMRAPYYYG